MRKDIEKDLDDLLKDKKISGPGTMIEDEIMKKAKKEEV